MNKNSVFAFIIILGSVMFFTSPTYNKFYTEKILKKEYKKKEIKKVYKEEVEKKEVEKKEILQDIEKNNIATETKKDSLKQDDTSSFVKKVDTVWIENDLMKIGINQIGAAIVGIKMKKYKNEKNQEKIDLIAKNSGGGAQIKIGQKDYTDDIFTINEIRKTKNKVVFEYGTDEEKIEKTFILNENSYEIEIGIKKNGLPGEKITLNWYPGIIESEKVKQKGRVNKKILHIATNGNIQHLVMKNKEKEGPIAGNYNWIGITSKYFFLCINNKSNSESEIKYSTVSESKKEINYRLEVSRIAENKKENFFIYAGPKERKELKKYNNNYQKVLFSVTGWTKIIFWSEKWFPWLADKVLLLLLMIQNVVKDYGIAIVIVTLISKVITYPMTMSSMKSMEKMKTIQPKVNKIREKNKNNPQKMNQEIMGLYKKEGVNPLNPGCLPMFLQAPVFISLFVVLQNAIEIRGTETILIPWITDLSKPEVLFSIKSILPNGIPMYGTNVALLPIIMAVLTFFQQKLTIKDPNQKMLIYFMPIFMLVLFNSFPSGLVLYWTFSNGMQLVQQLFMNKK